MTPPSREGGEGSRSRTDRDQHASGPCGLEKCIDKLLEQVESSRSHASWKRLGLAVPGTVPGGNSSTRMMRDFVKKITTLTFVECRLVDGNLSIVPQGKGLSILLRCETPRAAGSEARFRARRTRGAGLPPRPVPNARLGLDPGRGEHDTCSLGSRRRERHKEHGGQGAAGCWLAWPVDVPGERP